MEQIPGGDAVTVYLDDYYEILNEMKRRMLSACLTDSISRDFIVQMIPHHRAAVEMCGNVLRYPVSEPVQTLARTIVSQQTRGIAELETLLTPCAALRNEPWEVRRYLQRNAQILDALFYDMAHISGVGIEQNFLREMIPHHEGAVRMSENALDFCICRPLRPLLRGIIETQEREIIEMRRLLAEMNNSNIQNR